MYLLILHEEQRLLDYEINRPFHSLKPYPNIHGRLLQMRLTTPTDTVSPEAFSYELNVEFPTRPQNFPFFHLFYKVHLPRRTHLCPSCRPVETSHDLPTTSPSTPHPQSPPTLSSALGLLLPEHTIRFPTPEMGHPSTL